MRKILIYSATACVVVLTCTVIIVTHIASQLLSAAHLRLSDLSTNISPSQTTYTFLFLGVGGSEHEGPNLTDTIVLAQYDLVKNCFMLTSLPRDLWDPQTKDKINATYTYALTQQPQAPFEYVKEKYFTLTGITIDHVVVIDFTTFSKAIDALGGIDIVNDTAFIDRQFPLAGKENAICTPFDPTYACRYETVQFPAGPLHLDGAHALKYIRSRHSSDDQGTDFARAHRQQTVLKALLPALKREITSLHINSLIQVTRVLDSQLIKTIPNIFVLQLAKYVALHDKPFTYQMQSIKENFFIVPPYEKYDGRYVLVPNKEDYQELKKQLHILFKMPYIIM